MNPKDIVGRRFGHIEVLLFLRKEPYLQRYAYIYECRCDCGTVRELPRSNLITGHADSCGCRKATRPTGQHSQYWTGHGEISGRLWSHIKVHAATRELPFEVTIEEAWDLFIQQDRRCALSGIELSMRTVTGRAPSAVSASLDRIDNTKGYIRDNIQWLHKDINWMKGRFPQPRFLALCRAVTLHGGPDEHFADDRAVVGVRDF